jgi:hypothetical protein
MYVYIYIYMIYRSISRRRRRRSVRSGRCPRLGRSGPMVVWGGGGGVNLWLYPWSRSTSTRGPSRGGLSQPLSHQQGARYIYIYIYIYKYYIYGPAALIFICPSFWVRLGAAETMNVSHVRVNVGCASHVEFVYRVCAFTQMRFRLVPLI